MRYHVYVGTYSTSLPYVPDARGCGVVTAEVDEDKGTLRELSIRPVAGNSSYIELSADRRQLFVAIDRFDKPGELLAIPIECGMLSMNEAKVGTGGLSLCHVAAHPRDEALFLSGYSDGTLAVHRLTPAGLTPPTQTVRYQGSGSNTARQEAAHAHQAIVSRDGRHLYVVDLGSDKIWLHAIDALMHGEISPTGFSTPAGYGPRHGALSHDGRYLYVLCELSGAVLYYTRDLISGALRLLGEVSVLAEYFDGVPSAAAIRVHPNGRLLFASERASNHIAVFEVDIAGGLRCIMNFSVEGHAPRDFAISPSGRTLLVANQDSHELRLFMLDDKGIPKGNAVSTFPCGSPVSIVFN
jgi:6-phosphogluconolactonase